MKADLTTLVLESWESGQKPYLLAKLGADLMRRGHDLKIVLGGQKLAVLIDHDLGDKVRTFVDPNDEKVLWAVPADVADARPPERVPAAQRPQRLSLNRRIVEAFTTRLEPGMVRMVGVSPVLSVADVHRTTAEASGLPIITSQDLILEPIATPADRDRLQGAIEAWATLNNVATNLLAPPRTQRVRRTSGTSLFDALLETLDLDERTRITMPLDIVAKLMRTPGR